MAKKKKLVWKKVKRLEGLQIKEIYMTCSGHALLVFEDRRFVQIHRSDVDYLQKLFKERDLDQRRINYFWRNKNK